jgi:hypothetical protein
VPPWKRSTLRRATRRVVVATLERHDPPVGPTAASSASVSAPDPAPASTTVQPGRTSARDDHRLVLRIDHLCAALHLEDEVLARRAQDHDLHVAVGADGLSLARTEQASCDTTPAWLCHSAPGSRVTR